MDLDEIITSRVEISHIISELFATIPEDKQDLNYRFSPVDVDFNKEKIKSSKWLRDHGYIDSISRKFILPFSIHSSNKDLSVIMNSISKSLGLETVNAPFDFEGGNILHDGKYLFIGEDEIRKGIPYFFKSTEQAKEIISQFFQKEVHVLGASNHSNTSQEVFHLDLCVNFLGDKSVAVADIDILNKLIKSRSYSIDASDAIDLALYDEEQFYEEKIPSNLSPTRLILDSLHSHQLVSDSISAVHQDMHFKIASTRNYLNSISEQLADLGYSVIRTPFVPSLSEKRLIHGAHLTYNNALVENYSDDSGEYKRVYTMRYGSPLKEGQSPNILQLMDLTAQQKYESAGFKVLWLDGGVRNAPELGFLHCLTLEKRERSK